MRKFRRVTAFSMAAVMAATMLTACNNADNAETTTAAGITTTAAATAATTTAPETTTTKVTETQQQTSTTTVKEPETTTKAPEVEKTPQKGEIQVFTQSADTVALNEQLWNSREFTTRQMEMLDRGLVAVKTDEGVFVSWRWLGYEASTVKYNLYRDGKRVNAFTLNVTNYMDTLGTADSKYQVAAVVDGVEQEKCDAVSVWGNSYLEIQLDKPVAYTVKGNVSRTAEYEPNETSIADLDGDGEYEIVLKWSPTDAQDNSKGGFTTPTILDAYKMDGTKMWRINLGYNIRSGAHYTQFMVYDLDGDGKAEVVCKTADGTTDNAGNVVGDKDAYWPNGSGYVLDGPEYLTVFNGETGTIIDTIEYEVGRGKVSDWGDSYGNRVDRFLACVAYLNGKTPSVVMCRGYYTRAYLVAYNLVDGKLQKVWSFDSNDEGNGAAAGQGNHSVAVADVDMDGRDEIIYGSAAIDDDGTLMYSTGLGHGDAQHTGDLIPDRAGLEVFSVHESGSAAFGMEMRDARTGEILWGSYENSDVGRGVSADIDPNYPGAESWAAGKLVASTGEIISKDPTISYNFRIYWDGDLGEEVQDGNHIDKWISEKNTTKLLMTNRDFKASNGTKSTPGITCDMIGDWREETILFKNDGTSMAIFTTTIPTDYKIYTLMHDLQYRTYIATQNVAYNQPAHTGYYLGFDTTEIPISRVKCISDDMVLVNPELINGEKYYAIENLMRDETIVLKADVKYALVNDFMTRVDSANNELAPFEKNGTVYVPISFIADTYGVKVECMMGNCIIDGNAIKLESNVEIVGNVICVPVTVFKGLGKQVTVGNNGLVCITDEVFTLDSETADNLNTIITSYVEPVNAESDAPLSMETINEKKIPVVSATATTDDGNVAAGAVDGDYDTRWNGWDDGATLTLDLGDIKNVAAIAATFFKGNERSYYFDIEVSLDGNTWTSVLKAQESPITLDKELALFKFPETVEARYLRYVGHNSSSNNANNIWELVVLAP